MNEILDYDYFYKQLSAGIMINETCFYFNDDPEKEEHYIGYLPQYDKPYWVGYCDIPGGTEFSTAEELVKAKIFNGSSLKERWNNVRIIGIEGICLEDWLKYCVHA